MVKKLGLLILTLFVVNLSAGTCFSGPDYIFYWHRGRRYMVHSAADVSPHRSYYKEDNITIVPYAKVQERYGHIHLKT